MLSTAVGGDNARAGVGAGTLAGTGALAETGTGVVGSDDDKGGGDNGDDERWIEATTEIVVGETGGVMLLDSFFCTWTRGDFISVRTGLVALGRFAGDGDEDEEDNGRPISSLKNPAFSMILGDAFGGVSSGASTLTEESTFKGVILAPFLNFGRICGEA